MKDNKKWIKFSTNITYNTGDCENWNQHLIWVEHVDPSAPDAQTDLPLLATSIEMIIWIIYKLD